MTFMLVSCKRTVSPIICTLAALIDNKSYTCSLPVLISATHHSDGMAHRKVNVLLISTLFQSRRMGWLDDSQEVQELFWGSVDVLALSDATQSISVAPSSRSHEPSVCDVNPQKES